MEVLLIVLFEKVILCWGARERRFPRLNSILSKICSIQRNSIFIFHQYIITKRTKHFKIF